MVANGPSGYRTSVADKISVEDRSRLMARVSGKNTQPELRVRKALHAAGFRYRLHRRDLPGTPDLILPKFRTAVQVHGCFWHGHDCPKGRRPQSNVEFWNAKLDRNAARDEANRQALVGRGWHVLTVWECSVDQGIEHILTHLHALVGSSESAR
ncbi:MAG TPA: very short patch repair endonuclease [Allosphingosinicella sp.]|nr:very short patch repair endonuclease [Allosphingosinicella sp.]